jgi:hypothetical protein
VMPLLAALVFPDTGLRRSDREAGCNR